MRTFSILKAIKWGVPLSIGGVAAWSILPCKPIDTEAFSSPKRQVFTRSQVASHKTKDDRIWVSFGNGVYDITEFVDIHPGIQFNLINRWK